MSLFTDKPYLKSTDCYQETDHNVIEERSKTKIQPKKMISELIFIMEALLI